MVNDSIVEQIDYTIKHVWLNNISNDYDKRYLLREDSLKCSFYYHLRRKLSALLKENNLRIYPEFHVGNTGKIADLAIVRIDTTIEADHLKKQVTDIIAIIEFKYDKANSVTNNERWIRSDITKIKSYLQEDKILCQYYFSVIYEAECYTTKWMDGRSTSKWAKGYVTELDATYIDGIMKFEVNSYNGLNK